MKFFDNFGHTHILLMLTVLTGGIYRSNLIFNVYSLRNFSVIAHFSALEFGHVYRSDSIIFFLVILTSLDSSNLTREVQFHSITKIGRKFKNFCFDKFL